MLKSIDANLTEFWQYFALQEIFCICLVKDNVNRITESYYRKICKYIDIQICNLNIFHIWQT